MTVAFFKYIYVDVWRRKEEEQEEEQWGRGAATEEIEDLELRLRNACKATIIDSSCLFALS